MKMNLVNYVFVALTMLIGTEGVEYILLERDIDEWQIVSWLRRN